MINLANRTEYGFRLSFGHLQKVLDAQDKSYAGIVDRHGTWGHCMWQKHCLKRGIKPIFGVELALVDNPLIEEKQGARFIRFIAKNNQGLQELYKLVTKATSQFYYFPRIGPADVLELSENVYILTTLPLAGKNVWLDLNPTTQREGIEWAVANNIKPVATSDNFFPTQDDRNAYEICVGMNSVSKTTPMHILNEWEWRVCNSSNESYLTEALLNAVQIAQSCDAILPKAKLVHPKVDKTLRQMSEEGAIKRGIDLNDEVYKERLNKELEFIAHKQFEDYFFLIADMVQEAKKHMLVGPARGSSCGSLVCYLTQITDIDPIPHDLLFERFIDVNRTDLPDIDIDFPEDRREMVFEYLRNKYGSECVAQLGTVSRYHAKSTIGEVAKELNIPAWETKDLKDAIIERSGGDARAAFCIMDTFNELELGRKFLEKYPDMVVATEIEAHARHSGKHAAGIVVTADPVYNYCSVDIKTGNAQVDKYDAEALNLLKIDALGLRTLTLLQDCLDQIGWSKDQLLKYPLDDQKAFDVLNKGGFTGIFQFEGYALQSLCRQFHIDKFDDVVSVTALARPGPLISGMANQWMQRRTGKEQVEYEHPMMEDILKGSYGIVIYQENIMRIAREIGGMSWEYVNSLRQGMSKSLGKEHFDKYKGFFVEGAGKNGFKQEQAEDWWGRICVFGSWAFNKSHAVAYGTLSYWCLVLKAHYPLEYAAACLRHSKDTEQQIKLLRELHHEGVPYKAFDKDLSGENWTVQNGTVIGGLIGVKGVGDKTAKDIAKRRAEGKPLTPRQIKVMEQATTPYDMIFEAKQRWGHVFDNPTAHGIASKITFLKDIKQESEGQFVIIAKLTEKNLRDHNELIEIKKRGGEVMKGQTLFLNLSVEDDTETIKVGINRFKYEQYGKPIVEAGKIGDWYIFKGMVRKGFRKLYVQRWKKLS